MWVPCGLHVGYGECVAHMGPRCGPDKIKKSVNTGFIGIVNIHYYFLLLILSLTFLILFLILTYPIPILTYVL